jgi:two-component system CheB/CheR fusion protein
MAVELRSTLDTSRQKGRPVVSRPVRFNPRGESPRTVVLNVRPAMEPQLSGFALLIFDERDLLQIGESNADANGAMASADVRVRNLEAELLFARQRIQTIIENYETGQEELNASNEELRSANEELRSTMEELETSKEELQSVNEELHTVNQENRHKVEELAQLSTDLQNLLAATDIATIFLDRDLRILRFTPKVSKLFNVRVTDRGRPLLHLTHRLGYEQLEQDAREVLDQLVPVEREVQDNEQRWYLARVLPYRAVQDRIAGIVITLIDITSRKRIEEVLSKSEEFQRLSIEAGGIGTWDFDLRAAQCVISLKMAELLGYAPDATVLSRASWLASVVPEDRDGMEARLNASAESGAPFEMTFRVQTKDGIVRWLYTRGAISASDGNSVHMHGASIDITARLQAESALRQSEQRFRALVDVSAAMVWTTNADGTTTEDSPSWRAFTGQTYEIWTSRGWLNAVHGDDRAQVESAWRRSLQTGTPLMSECRVYHAPSGEYRWTSVRAVPLEDSDGSVGGWVGMHIDISDLKETDRRKDELGHSGCFLPSPR